MRARQCAPSTRALHTARTNLFSLLRKSTLGSFDIYDYLGGRSEGVAIVALTPPACSSLSI
eukprot:6897053-Pyramimonas_sp.AAC.1